MKKIIASLLFIVLAVMTAMAQQDCPQVDCPGICGRFVDADGDGFCDHGQLSAKKEEPATQTAQTPEVSGTKKTVHATTTPASDPQTDIEASSESVQETSEIKEVADEPAAAPEAPKPFRYPLFTLLGITLGLYFVTSILVKTGTMAKPTHRKIWNVVLALTCAGSCLIGLLLAFFINYGYRPGCYIDLLHWHVYFGIAMTIIAIIHFIWHWGYYKAMITRKK